MGLVRISSRRTAPIVAAILLTAAAVFAQPSFGQSCSRRDFEQVVDEAAAALRDLNAKNKPAFQDKLRILKEKRGWSTDQFMIEASTFVQDDKIGEYDQASADLLTRINSMGAEGATAATPDCSLLVAVNGAMKDLVEGQRAKWTYMFGKIEGAIAGP